MYTDSGVEVRKLMRSLVGEEWDNDPDKYGNLVFVVAEDGSSEWVHPTGVEDFKKMGAKALAGQEEEEEEEKEIATTLTPQQPSGVESTRSRDCPRKKKNL